MSRRWLAVQVLLAVACLAQSVRTGDTLAAAGYVTAGGLAALCAGANLGARAAALPLTPKTLPSDKGREDRH